jgi:hypothetical protein
MGLRDQTAKRSFHLSYSQECWNQSLAAVSAGSAGKILDALQPGRPLGLLSGYCFKVIVLGGFSDGNSWGNWAGFPIWELGVRDANYEPSDRYAVNRSKRRQPFTK